MNRVFDVVGACLEMTQAQKQASISELFKREGEKPKLIGLGRCFPGWLVRIALDKLKQDTLPVAEQMQPGYPMAYGGEVVVYELPGKRETPLVLKVSHSLLDIDQQVAKAQKNLALYQKHFPGLATHANFFLFESQFGTSNKSLGMLQSKKEGLNLIDEWLSASSVDIAEIISGTKSMIVQDNVVPDLLGDGNVLVDQCGKISIVDCGSTFDIHDIRTAAVVQFIAQLENQGTSASLLVKAT